MVTLSVLRHAKSAWNKPVLRDFDRPLAPRGRKAAPRMGRFIAENELEPQIVLCSTAVRARQTLELVLPAFRTEPEVQYTDALYHAGPNQMLGLLRKLPDSCGHAMLIGHNPGLHALVLDLSGGGDEAALERLCMKFPTAALAVVEFDFGWREIGERAGTLRRFVRPKDIA